MSPEGRAGTDDGPRHSVAWYRERFGSDPVPEGGHLMIPCDGGPSTMRFEVFPPRLEIEVRGGVYVLADEGHHYAWRYHFVSSTW